MYVFLVGLVALMLFGIYQVLDSRTVRVYFNQMYLYGCIHFVLLLPMQM